MIDEIKPNTIYTTEETQTFLKISSSTMKRLLKKGILKANKIGRQYRILGKEILRLISPKIERTATSAYMKLKKKAINKIKNW